jgi:hypothetical protein
MSSLLNKTKQEKIVDSDMKQMKTHYFLPYSLYFNHKEHTYFKILLWQKVIPSICRLFC